jgi:hypothetical protein
MPVNRCQYSKECPVFKGDATTNGIPLALYKNVFCNRGAKGWNNCEQYLEFKVNTVSKKISLMLKKNKNID